MLHVYMYGQSYSRVWIKRVRLSILLVVSWTEKMNIPLSPFVSKNLISRHGFRRPGPRQPPHSPYSGWIWSYYSWNFLPISAIWKVYPKYVYRLYPGGRRIDRCTFHLPAPEKHFICCICRLIVFVLQVCCAFYRKRRAIPSGKPPPPNTGFNSTHQLPISPSRREGMIPHQSEY